MFKILNFKLKIVLVILFVLITYHLSLITPKARAQEMRTFTVVPPAVEKTLNPDDKAEGIMKIINDSSEPLTFRVDIQDYIVTDSKGTPNILPPNTLSAKYSAASWLGVVPYNFTVQPHQKATLNYYLQIPQDAKPGGHYTAVVFLPLSSDSLQGSGASVQTKVGTLFKINVNGAINEYSNVTKFFTESFSEYGPVKIQTRIKNSGDVHVKPIGAITITDLLGRTIEEQKIEELNIFPEAARDYENTIGAKFMVGRFKASLLGSYGKNNNLPVIATVYFWVFPWKIAIVAILIMVVIILGLILKGRKINTPQNKPQEESTPAPTNG